MAGEYNPRVSILLDRVEKTFSKVANDLGWQISLSSAVDRHSYVTISISRESVTHTFGYLYSQSTDKSVYSALASTVEVIFVQGLSFDPDNVFSKDCAIPVLPDSDFLHVMTDWNMEFLGIQPRETSNVPPAKESFRIIDENPLEQIYTHLRSLTSKSVAKQAVLYRGGDDIPEPVLNKKAEGVSYLVQNAIDYYDSAATNNMTQRLLNLYYGTLALMEAEMLIHGDRYTELAEIENVTKNGHGMLTFGDATSLKDYYIGVLDKGLFQAWLTHRGVDTSGFCDSRKKAEKSPYVISLDELFRYIPELQNVMQETEIDYKPYFLFPSFDMSFSHISGIKETVYDRKYVGSYINFLNLDGETDFEWEKKLIDSFLGPITIVGKYTDTITKSTGWRVFVEHSKEGYHYNSYQTHKGLSASMVIAPLFGKTDDWEVFAVMILYALSIIVRYMPNLWARMMHGELDHYKAVIYQFSRVAERELTKIFLEKITGKTVRISHPQSLI
ncbi:MAG: hypothetical protein Q4D40_02990 [Eubacteriales bacterium]|nr:hypothetical protein [Eubacteriales bacterium]